MAAVFYFFALYALLRYFFPIGEEMKQSEIVQIGLYVLGCGIGSLFVKAFGG